MSQLIHSLHPGEVLAELYLNPLGIGAATLAEELDLPRTLVQGILDRRADISGDTAARLARRFSTTRQFWTNLQRQWDQNSGRVQTGAPDPVDSALKDRLQLCRNRKNADSRGVVS